MKITATFRHFLTIGLVALTLTASGCSNGEWAAYRAWGSKHKITLYSGGVQVGTWETTGKICNEHSSDGYYFEDLKTHKFVSVSGTVVIEAE